MKTLRTHSSLCYIRTEEEPKQLIRRLDRNIVGGSIYGYALRGKAFHVNFNTALHFQIGISTSEVLAIIHTMNEYKNKSAVSNIGFSLKEMKLPEINL